MTGATKRADNSLSTTGPLQLLWSKRSQVDPNLLIILLWPILLAAVDNGWIFSPIGHTDTWIYFGYFNNLTQHLNLFPDAYFGTRLSWILPGYLAYHVFPPLIANYVLHLYTYYIGTLSLYFILKIVFNRRTALIAVLLMGCHVFFLRAVGWDYTDGIGISHVLLTFLLITCSTKFDRWRLFTFAAGIAYALLIYINLFWLVVTPVFIAYHFIANFHYRRNNFFHSLIFFAGGLLTVTFIFGYITYRINGNWLFLYPNIEISAFVLNYPNTLGVPTGKWILRATWLVFPVCMLLTSVVFIVLNRTKRSLADRLAFYFQLPLIGVFVIFGTIEALHIGFFQYNYYADYPIPFAFLALGALLAAPLAKLTARQYRVLVGLALIILALPFVFLPIFQSVLPFPTQNQIVLPIIFMLAALFLILFARPTRPTILIYVGVFVCFMLANYFMRDYSTIIRIQDEIEMPRTMGNQDEFLTIYDGFQAIRSTVPQGDVIFWYDRGDSRELADLYRSLGSTYTWWTRYIKVDFPHMDTYQIPSKIIPGRHLVVLSNQPDVLKKALSGLSEIGLSAKVIDEVTIEHGSIRLKLTFLEVTNLVI